MKIYRFVLPSIMLFIFSVPGFAQNPDPVIWWDFSSVDNRTTIEKKSGVADTLEGNFLSICRISSAGFLM